MFKNLFGFTGRIRRTEYCLTVLVVYPVILFLAIAFTFPMLVQSYNKYMGVWSLGSLVILIPVCWILLAQSVKRCHDRGWSGLMYFIPYFTFVLMFIPGEKRNNAYGTNPYETSEDETLVENAVLENSDPTINPFLKEGIHVVTASKWLRLINFIIDTLIIFVIYVLIDTELSKELQGSFAYVILENINFYLIFIFYYLLFEFFTGRTLGKILTQTKVVTLKDQGERSLSTILLRTICRFIPFEVLSNFGDGWHDTFSKTMVVKATRIPEEFQSGMRNESIN